MAKEKEIHDIQKDHFSPESKEWTSHYAIDDEELEKHLDKVEKEFMKKERELARINKKYYLASKIDAKRDEMFRIHHEDGEK